MRRRSLCHEFVEFVPDQLHEGVLYISLAYNTAVHKCCCGCGNEVVTPISPVDWTLGYNGESITLRPSIGNYSFECRSHYWITRNRVDWSPVPSLRKIEDDREADRLNRLAYFEAGSQSGSQPPGEGGLPTGPQDTPPWWRRAVRRLLDD